MRISVFGLGYVGSVTAAWLARAGHEVIGVDVNAEKVAMMNAGTPPVVEPGLGELLAEVVGAGRLRATITAEDAVGQTDLALVCVGTPSRENGQPDVRAVEEVSREIGRALRRRGSTYTVVLRSTVPPGTTDEVVIPALTLGAQRQLDGTVRVAVNPEFMREGSSLHDFGDPPFVLVGSADPATAMLVKSLHAGVAAPFIHTPVRTAEMIKYVSNAFHALKVCFANEIGDLCSTFHVDPQEVMQTFLMDRKLNVSEAYLRPGFAFGGSCLPKDLRALVSASRAAELSSPLLSAILPSNEAQIRRAADAVLKARKRRVGVVGLAFKPGTDDLRESPIVTLVETLIGKGLDVRIFDPNVAVARLVGANRRYIEEEIPHIASLLCETVEAVATYAEVLVISSVNEEAAQALAVAPPGVAVIDLTRGAVQRLVDRRRQTQSIVARAPVRA
jgi:GDP-mannose 6-dehydrogenase